jgi:hypothetical protein
MLVAREDQIVAEKRNHTIPESQSDSCRAANQKFQLAYFQFQTAG